MLIRILISSIFATAFLNAELFFSEQMEGSSNNKYLEIYNPSASTVDLSDYAMAFVTNTNDGPGDYEYWVTFPEGASIPAYDVFVIAHESVFEEVLLHADWTYVFNSVIQPTPPNLTNGNDGRCLVKGTESSYTILDCIGDWATSGTYWDVAGVEEATRNHTIVRKSDVVSGNSGNWSASAGTNTENSEWIVKDLDDWTDVGSHTYDYAMTATIQEQINAASNGDTVLIQPGTYTEKINFNGKNIVVGSLYLTTGDTSYISSTIIDGNQSGSVVQINNSESSAELCGLTIQNGKHAYGGGIAIDGATVKITNCKIIDNHSPLNIYGTGPGGSGGGGLMIRNENNASVTIENCKIINNSSGDYGGGIHADHNNTLTIKNSKISNNTTSSGGGAIYHKANLNLENCLFSNNRMSNNSGGEGGAIRSYYQANVDINSCTFVDNSARRGGAIHFETNGACTIKNSIIRGNSATFGSQISAPGTVQISYSNIEGEEEEIHLGEWEDGNVNWGSGNTDSDPKFLDAANGDYRLSDYSPAIGAGTSAGAPATDINGVTRPTPANTSPDMGAYENALGEPLEQTIYYVSTSGSESGSGLSGSPMSSIQDAIDASSNGDTVLVSAGTYTENIIYNGKNIIVKSASGPASTVLKPSNSSIPIVRFMNGESTSAYLIGFTIQDVGLKEGAAFALYQVRQLLKTVL